MGTKEKAGKLHYSVRTTEKMIIASNHHTTLKCYLLSGNNFLTEVCGIVEPKASFEEKTGLSITSSLSNVSRKFYTELLKLQELDNIDPQLNNKYRDQFLQGFSSEESVLNHEDKQHVEDLLIDISDLFVKHRFDVGYNSEIRMKLTPEHDQHKAPPPPTANSSTGRTTS